MSADIECILDILEAENANLSIEFPPPTHLAIIVDTLSSNSNQSKRDSSTKAGELLSVIGMCNAREEMCGYHECPVIVPNMMLLVQQYWQSCL